MESPDTIFGRMKEGAHVAGYSSQRAMENLRWLLEDERYKELSEGYENVNDFLRAADVAFSLLKIKPEGRKQIAQLVKDLQPKASDRAIADMVKAIYRDTDPRLHGAAALSVLAHLEDLVDKGLVTTDGPARLAGIYHPGCGLPGFARQFGTLGQPKSHSAASTQLPAIPSNSPSSACKNPSAIAAPMPKS